MARESAERTLGLMGERMFLAVALDDECRHAVAAHLGAALGERMLPGRPARPESWHITLRFLGDTTAQQADAILAHLDEHLMVDPFRVKLAGLGGFPREKKASVLWIGAVGDLDPLHALAAECETAAQRAGFEPEGRPFHPHVTLSRIRPPTDVRRLVDLVPDSGIPIDVGAVTLYRSLLGSGPARYEVVDTVAL
ncbi:MAG: RNA 2',3'-cyclic phosphodiesterase [Acidimicrobiia bacterium]|nr:RNA 2',3'-cyclic phosphodiesterase [Acidimicrobiia bacterium]